MHIARLKQRDLGRYDFTCIRIVPMHGFMKNSDYSCTVTMHVQKIQKIASIDRVRVPRVAAFEACSTYAPAQIDSHSEGKFPMCSHASGCHEA